MGRFSTRQYVIFGGAGVVILGLIALVVFSISRGGGDAARDVRNAYGQQKAGVTTKRTTTTTKTSATPAPSKNGGTSVTTTTTESVVAAVPPPIAPPTDSTRFGENVVPALPTATPGNAGAFGARPALPDAAPDVVVARQSTDNALLAPAPTYSAPPVPDSLLTPQLPESRSRTTAGGGTTASVVDQRRYLFNNQAPEALAGKALIFSDQDAVAIDRKSFAPMGEAIDIAFMTSAAGNNTEIDVTAGVWYPFYFQGHKILEVGDKLLGKAAPGKARDRLVVKFYKVVFKDGKSMPITAVAEDVDGTYGVKGFLVGDAILQSMTPVLLEMSAAFIETFKTRALSSLVPSPNVNVSLPLGAGVSTNTSGAGDQTASPANAGLQAVQGGFQKISQLLAADIEENKPYIVVPAGTRCRAYLQNLIDTSSKDFGK